VDDGEWRRVGSTLRAFHRRFAPLFGRKEARQRSGQYLRGLLVQQTDRRNAENLAEAVAGATPRALQRFLSESPWADAPVRAALQEYLGERLLPGAPGQGAVADGVSVVDDTGFAKPGTRSVGVARQDSGTAGKVATCQIGVVLGSATARGHALADAALDLPRAWVADPARCRRAGVPAAVLAAGYQRKADLALGLLRRARATGAVVGRWVAADAGYGEVPTFRDALDAEGWRSVLEVPGTTPVFPRAARTRRVRLRPGAAPRAVAVLPAAQPVQAWAAARPARQWRPLTVAEGAQGPRTYQFAAARVWESRDGLPGRRTWLLARRNLDGSELKYAFANAPPETPLRELARVGATRWPIETEFRHGKGEVGLDEYEVRSWRGWHHHVTLALLAGAFLLTLEQDWGEKAARDHPAAGHPRPARGAAAPALDAQRRAPVAGRPVPPQRPRQGLPHQTPALHPF
jgi:SRSO17 transposase